MIRARLHHAVLCLTRRRHPHLAVRMSTCHGLLRPGGADKPHTFLPQPSFRVAAANMKLWATLPFIRIPDLVSHLQVGFQSCCSSRWVLRERHSFYSHTICPTCCPSALICTSSLVPSQDPWSSLLHPPCLHHLFPGSYLLLFLNFFFHLFLPFA